jgi:hypothetical protein
MSKNSITGDALVSKLGNKAAFDEGYDRIFGKGGNMATDTKDVEYCKEGKHIVPADEMTSIDTGQKGYRRPCCNSCKDKIISLRKAAKTLK